MKPLSPGALAVALSALVGANATASAADLSKRAAAAAVDYVKVCDAYGAGFFYIPGGETCLKIGGFVRYRAFTGGDNAVDDGIDFAMKTSERFSSLDADFVDAGRTQNKYSTDTTASVTFDARSNTEFGLLRSYIDARFGVFSPDSDGKTTSASVDKAFVQWGGLTAGYATSFFDFYTGASLATTYGPFVSDQTTNLVAYTGAFGGGFSASLAIEDAKRSEGRGLNFFGSNPVGLFGSDGGTYFAAEYGGNRVPDIVANLSLVQSWGSAQLSAAGHQNYDRNVRLVRDTLGDTDPTNDVNVDVAYSLGQKWGYAVQAGVKINLRGVDDGDYIAFQAGYTVGALKYLGLSSLADDYLGLVTIGTGTLQAPESVSLEQTRAWSINAGVNYHVFDQVSVALDAGYADIDNAGPYDYGFFRAATSTTWTPAAGLGVSLGLEYQKQIAKQSLKDEVSLFGLNYKSAEAWVALMEVKRSF